VEVRRKGEVYLFGEQDNRTKIEAHGTSIDGSSLVSLPIRRIGRGRVREKRRELNESVKIKII